MTMTSRRAVVLSDPKGRIKNHLEVLQKYARRRLEQDDVLMPWEEADKNTRIEDSFQIGDFLECTPKDLTKVILRDLTSNKG